MKSEERTPLELVMFAAWVNAEPNKLPAEMRGHTCEATMTAWRRVADAAREYLLPSPTRPIEEYAMFGTKQQVKEWCK